MLVELEMNKFLQFVFALAIVVTLTGCSTSYMTNRCRDAADIVTIGVGAGLGAKARVGPIQIGLLDEFGLIALRGGAVGDGIIACNDHQYLVTGEEHFHPVVSIGLTGTKFKDTVFAARGKTFQAGGSYPFWSHVAQCESAPYYYTQLELVGALLGSVRVGVNPGELVDFALGWTAIDIYGDDIHVEGSHEYTVAHKQATVTGFRASVPSTLSVANTLGGYPVTRIGDNAFYGRTELTCIVIGSNVAHIGDSAFQNCMKLTGVTIPDSVNHIDRSAFGTCSSLTNIDLPGQLSKLGPFAFERCTNLTSIVIPGGVAKIEDWTFQDCSALSNITLRNGVTSIGWCAFDGCSSLTEITIPASVTGIGPHAFSACPKLTRVRFEGNAPRGASDASIFGDGSSNVSVYYLPGTKGWGKEFGGRPTAVWKQ